MIFWLKHYWSRPHKLRMYVHRFPILSIINYTHDDMTIVAAKNDVFNNCLQSIFYRQHIIIRIQASPSFFRIIVVTNNKCWERRENELQNLIVTYPFEPSRRMTYRSFSLNFSFYALSWKLLRCKTMRKGLSFTIRITFQSSFVWWIM